MEASALHATPSLQRLSLTGPLLRLRSDEQLVALFRAGSEDAFTVIHDRYKQRLFAYVRQMMAGGSKADAEDVLQDVFVRAYGALRNDDRDVNLRAWLYRVAHNRCIDHFRRPTPACADIFDVSRTPLQDPIETAQRREDLTRLVADVGRLPEQQRSALLMREIDGLAYADIALALEVTVPAVKSLLVRARVGLAEAIEARDTDCAVIRDDLMASYDRGVKASGRARKHMRECAGCREYRTSLKSLKRSFAALTPVGVFGPLAIAAKALGIGAGGGAAAGGSAVGGGAAVVGGATACKVAAVVCTAAIATGGAVEVKRAVVDRPAKPERAVAAETAAAPAAAAVASAAAAPVEVTAPVIARRTEPTAPAISTEPTERAPMKAAVSPIVTDAPAPVNGTVEETLQSATGGTVAPAADTVTKPLTQEQQAPAPTDGTAPTQDTTQQPAPPAQESDAAPSANGGTSSDGPPPEH